MTQPLRTFWLSFHAPYTCRHSGACCSSAWDIDIDRARVGAISSAIAAGRLAAPAQWYRVVQHAPEDVAGVLAVTASGGCVFHRAPGCAVHTVLGHEALPSACQHFPRIALIDRRGIFVTLSHYCPTAAALLFEAAGRATVVEGPPVLSSTVVPEGLDAREALPPLDTPGRLMDLDEYSRWERDLVERLTGAGPLARTLAAFDPDAPPVSDEALFAIARDAVPPPHLPPAFTPSSATDGIAETAIVGQFLAAHAFASWMAYQGNGRRCTLLYLRLALAVLQSEQARLRSLAAAFRHADLLLRHLADRQALADRLSELAAR